MSSNAINNPNNTNNSNLDGLRRNIISQLLFKFGDIKKIVDDLEKTSSKKDEINTKRDELNSFYDNLEDDILTGLYDNDEDVPEEIFDEYIDNLKNELSSLTDKKLDGNNDDVIENPSSCENEVIQWLDNDILIPRGPTKDDYGDFIYGKNEEYIKDINRCLVGLGIAIDGVNLVEKPLKPNVTSSGSGGGSGGGAGGVGGVGVGVGGVGAGGVGVGGVGVGAGGGSGGVVSGSGGVVSGSGPVVSDVKEKAKAIQSLLSEEDKLSLEPNIASNAVTIVSIYKEQGEKGEIKYDILNVNNSDPTEYLAGKYTYNPPTYTYNPPTTSKGFFRRGGNRHLKTIHKKHNNHHKTKKAAKKHLSKRKQVKLNKNRKTHHK